MSPRYFFGAALLLGALILSQPASAQTGGSQDEEPATLTGTSDWPAEIRTGYKHFRINCSGCHTAAPILRHRYAARTWRKYVVRMMRKPEAELDRDTGRSIYRFLRYYTQITYGDRQAPVRPQAHPAPAPTTPPQGTPTR